MIHYHYTKGCLLPSIVRDGIIKASKENLDKQERPVVWLSKSPHWEVACNKGKVLYGNIFNCTASHPKDIFNSITVNNDYMKREVGMCRILISETVPLVSWDRYKYAGNIPESVYEAIDSYSRSIGSPVDKWFCSFNPIPNDYWVGIEMFVNDKWVKWEKMIPIEDFVELCLKCNGKQKSDDNSIHPTWDVLERQTEFINRWTENLISLWQSNKHIKGYIEAYVNPDYSLYDFGFVYIEKRVNHSSFEILRKSETNHYALVHFHWGENNTHIKIAIPY